jgi:hypothetical protein
MDVKNSTGGHPNGLKLFFGINRPGADGLHFFGACNRITGSGITVQSGDDAQQRRLSAPTPSSAIWA